MKKRVILFILDGFGVGEKNITNPFRFVETKNLDYLKKNYPYVLLNASGLSVGLPSNSPGNCQTGHLTLGTGTVYYQNLVRIDIDIENGEFFQNQNFGKLFEHLKKYNSRLHLIGLLSQGLTQTSFNHLIALLKLCKKESFFDVYLHLFTDGIDSPPKSALTLLEKLKDEMQKQDLPGKIATLCGRFYALDQTGNYLFRTQKTYLLLVEGKGKKIKDPIIYLREEKYKDTKFNDSLLEPLVIDEKGILQENDAILFFHFENKSINQLARAFLDPNFKEFERVKIKNLLVASLTRYFENIDYLVIYEKQKILNNLSSVLAKNGIKQFKLIDSSREKLFRFYFNGFIEEEYPYETFKILPPFEGDFNELKSKAQEFIDALIVAIKEDYFDFIMANLPLFEIVGHSADFNLALKIISEVDNLIGRLYPIALENNYSLIITSDHGNIEKMVDIATGAKETFHDPSPVPFYLIDNDFKKEKTASEMAILEKKVLGNLFDVAPTILDLFGIPQPKEFIGKSLLKYFHD